MLLEIETRAPERSFVRCAWEAGCVLGEGPVWDTGAQKLWFVDIKGDAILTYDARRGGRVLPFAGSPSAVVPIQSNGDLLCVGRCGLERYSLSWRTRTLLTPVEPDLPGNRPNDGKVDRQGRFWFGTMDETETAFSGSLYRVEADGTATLILSDIGVANGLDWSPDGAWFYHTDSLRRTIWRFHFDAVEGVLGERSQFAKLAPEDGAPDGLTVDEEGFVWSAHWDGWRITRYDPDGRVDRVVDMPVPRPTSLCFGGPDLSVLYVTSARIGLSPAALAAAPLSGALFEMHPGVRGLAARPVVLK